MGGMMHTTVKTASATQVASNDREEILPLPQRIMRAKVMMV
jgi:hypothetical protein